MKHIPRTIFILSAFTFVLSGCGKSMNLLLEIDKEDKAIKRDIAVGAKKIDLLLKDIETGRLKTGLDKKDAIARYGQPVLEFIADNQMQELLYRHPLKYFDSPKVYLYFDRDQKLAKWDIVRLEADK